jgi:hypothetical protein
VSDEIARAALRDALDALAERGETVEVFATVQGVTTDRLFDLAADLRNELRPDAGIAWVGSGALA